MENFDFFGIVNPLIDIFIEIDDSVIKKYNLLKGSNSYLDEEVLSRIISEMNIDISTAVPGGGPANTAMALSFLGKQCIITGTLGKGKYADKYERIIKEEGISSGLVRNNEKDTGKVLALITPDKERTFASNLGAGGNLDKNKIDMEALSKSKILYMTAYELVSLKDAAFECLEKAKKDNKTIVLDLGDSIVINNNRDYILKIIKNYCNILFMNQKEMKALLQNQNIDHLQTIDIVIQKLGSKGSIIYYENQEFPIKPHKVQAVDTTGAGDLYAAGFLYGWLNDWEINKCGMLGSFISSRIVTQYSARMSDKVKEEVREFLKKI